MVPISEKMAPFAEEGTIRRMEGSISRRRVLSSEEGFCPQKKGSILGRRFYPQMKDSILVGLSPYPFFMGCCYDALAKLRKLTDK